MGTPANRLSRRIVLINAVVFTVGTLLLAVSPATVSAPVLLTEIPVLAIGLAVILAANAFLLRRSLAPIDALTDVMARVDLLRGTDRVAPPQGGDLTSLVEAFNAMLDRLETERSTSSGHALAAQEAERRRIARELHDEIGQGLTASLLALRRTADRAPEELRADLHAVQETVRACLDDVRNVARRLRPDMLEDLGLVSSLTALSSELADASDVTVVRSIDPDLPPLSSDVELVIYRVAQEAMTNIARHADAKHVAVGLGREGNAIVLRVRDDGRGGVAEQAVEEGAGIRGMRERALLVGGRLTFRTPEGGGTEVRLEVPL
ncbi:two-component system, NarL family, sensor histidine kinase UhpB [Pseudonocardia thermophila]|jgi:Signal transduction histidine kinase|uniref:histidine kinase n=1 Tax=Pseudonocardia thermophila TaxID=1848 RepID=A0A1M6WWR4_PSETH|nr:sensor histidine kinase [Pseudonocardia thermophila]SHK97995.1 two-component system, NarL family, sensor histidine kinase UhpB [Pseudonocardia thermophila]